MAAPGGVWLASLGLAAAVMGGIWHDSDEIEHVRLYRIVRP